MRSTVFSTNGAALQSTHFPLDDEPGLSLCLLEGSLRFLAPGQGHALSPHPPAPWLAEGPVDPLDADASDDASSLRAFAF